MTAMLDWLPALNWIWLFAAALLVMFGALGSLLIHRTRDRVVHQPLLLFSVLPLLYATVVWSGLISDDFLRLERQWAAPLPTLAGLFLLWRLHRLSDRSSAWRRRSRDTLSVLCALLLGLCVAGVQLGTPLDRLAIIVAVDESRSIDLVNDAETRIRRELQLAELGMREDDQLGVLLFGSNSQVQMPLRRRAERPTPQIVSIARDATDIEAAIRRGLLELPSDARGKVVLLSDGVATRGDTFGGVAAALAAEVPVDVVPLEQLEIENVRLVNLTGPSSVSEGETFDLRAVVDSPVEQELEIRVLEDGELIRTGKVTVRQGQDVLSLRQRATRSGLRRYRVELSASLPERDQLTEDNQRSTFVKVRGQATALVLSQNPEEAIALETALRSAEIDVRSVGFSGAPTNVAEFAGFDLVILRDLPAHMFTPTQLDAFAAHVRAIGGGLMLMGSERSMGPGGYGKTSIEDISPVSFDLKQDRRRGRLAQVIAIDYSGSMAAKAGEHTKLELANDAAARSIELLSPGDQLGVMHVDTTVSWTLPLADLRDKAALIDKLRSVGPGGGGIYVDLSLSTAYAALRREKTNLKHVLLFADGSDAEERNDAPNLVRAALQQGITTSVVALGQGNDVGALEQLSRIGDGRFYLIEDARRLPAVFAQETIMAARSAIDETEFVPTPRSSAGPLRGVNFEQTPALSGYVITIPKQRTQTWLSGPEQDPILASWSVGLGRAGAFTSDYTGRWGARWTRWPEAAQLFAQFARSLARAVDDAQLRLRADARAGHIEVNADVLSSGSFVDSYKRLEVNISGPGGIVQRLPLTATGAGRYSGRLPLQRPGAYVVTAVDVASGNLVGTAGAELHPADELKPTGTDRGTLTRIARESGGRLRDTLAGLFNDRLGPRFSYRDITNPLLWLSALLLLLSVAARRLSVPEALLAYATALRQLRPHRRRKPQIVAATTLLQRKRERQAFETGAADSAPQLAQPPKPQRPAPAAQASFRGAAPPPSSARRPRPTSRPPPMSPAPEHNATTAAPKKTAAQVLLERRRKSKR